MLAGTRACNSTLHYTGAGWEALLCETSGHHGVVGIIDMQTLFFLTLSSEYLEVPVLLIFDISRMMLTKAPMFDIDDLII